MLNQTHLIYAELLEHNLNCLLAVHKALGNDIGHEQFVAMPKLVERHTIGIALTTDAYTLEHTVAAQLLQHK
jgi:hypothetical protein